MKRIKSLDVTSVFRISLVLGGMAGFLMGSILLITDLWRGDVFEGVLAFFLAPIVNSVLGALVNAFMAKVYNLVAARLGGIALELE